MNSKQFLSGAEKSFPFRILSGEGLDREISGPCALVHDGTEGFWRGVKGGRIVIINHASLESFPSGMDSGTSCLFISGCDSCPPAFVDFLAAKSIPLVISNMEQELLASRVTGLLREKLESTVSLHGSMVVYRDTGVLVTGESGAGKSRCCLDLLGEGARLVADDLVEIKREEGRLYGKSPEQIRNMIEIRGAGLFDVRTLFGGHAVTPRAGIDLAFEISAGTKACKSALEIMGVQIPLEIIRADSGKPVSQFVKEACERRCRDNY
ncbi:MAG: hypothetical protein ABFD62_04805 [Syntrophaceae bacterium]